MIAFLWVLEIVIDLQEDTNGLLLANVNQRNSIALRVEEKSLFKNLQKEAEDKKASVQAEIKSKQG